MCRNIFLIKLTKKMKKRLLIKRRLEHSFFLVKYALFLITLAFTEHLQWLLMNYLGTLLILAARMLV